MTKLLINLIELIAGSEIRRIQFILKVRSVWKEVQLTLRLSGGGTPSAAAAALGDIHFSFSTISRKV
jgi:hypothetical protein